MSRKPTVLIANPSPDVYGSDLQMLESVSALVEDGSRVIVALPADGQLVGMLRARGAEVEFFDFPVLRRANQSDRIVPRDGRVGGALGSPDHALIRRLQPDAVYVNTVTLPWWLLAARLSRVATLCHLHEAENTDSRLVRLALMSPLRLAHAVIVISRSAMTAMLQVDGRLAKRAHLIYNGVPQPPTEPDPAPASHRTAWWSSAGCLPARLPHVALDAAGLLRQRGYDVSITLAGTAFEGYEWYVEQLDARAEAPDLAGQVDSPATASRSGPCSAIPTSSSRPPSASRSATPSSRRRCHCGPSWPPRRSATWRASSTRTPALLVPPGDVEATAAAIAELIDNPGVAASISARARASAIDQFSTDRYSQELCALVDTTAARHTRR